MVCIHLSNHLFVLATFGNCTAWIKQSVGKVPVGHSRWLPLPVERKNSWLEILIFSTVRKLCHSSFSFLFLSLNSFLLNVVFLWGWGGWGGVIHLFRFLEIKARQLFRSSSERFPIIYKAHIFFSDSTHTASILRRIYG